MEAAKNSVVLFHYTVTEQGSTEVIDTSRERGEPIAVLIGHGGLIPGVERALEGRKAGDRFDVTIAPADAYGERREDATQRVPKKFFRDGDRLRTGMQTVLQTTDGQQRVVTVSKVGMSVIDVDMNHPLAGKTLSFDLEVVEVREASEEERAHGHVHGPGGHHH